ncbi:MAG TPA: hypothetical protein VF681_12960 [Abditibacteriaceae bacterium]|jgi:hypothetical protein
MKHLMLCRLTAVLIGAWLARGVAAQTTPTPTPAPLAQIAITDVIAAPKPERFGAHLQLEINKPRYLDNSMEPTNFRYRFDITRGGTTSFVVNNADIFDTIRDGFLNGANAFIYRMGTNGPSLVRRATIATHSATTGELTLTTDGAPILAGDTLFLNITWTNPPISRMASRLTWGSNPWARNSDSTAPGSVVRDGSTVPPANGGRSSLKLRATGAGEFICRTTGAQFADANQGYYPTLEAGKTYCASVWLKSYGLQNSTVTLRLTSNYSDISHTWNTTSTWTKYSFDFVAPAWPTEGVVSEMQLVFNGPGTVWADNIALYDAAYAPFAPDPREITNLRNFKIGSMRTFGSFNASQTLATWTDEAEIATVGWDINYGSQALSENKLPTVLRAAQQVGGTPWLVVGGQINEDEWRQLIEYLAAPYSAAAGDTPQSRPYAWKRVQQGQSAPWTSVFPKIRLEFCNEAWNPMFGPWAFDAETYGKYAQYFYSKAKSSAFYQPAKFDLILNGWVIQTDENGFGQTARKNAPVAQAVDTTAYVGGWERGIFVGGSTLNDAGFQDTLLFPAYDSIPMHAQHARTRDALAAKGFPYELMVYESGPSYSLPSGGEPFSPVQEQYGKSLAAGVCTLDMLLFNSLVGYTAQNYFTFSHGQNWASHALVSRGGHPYPSWSALQMRNRYANGAMVVTQTLKSPATDVVRPTENVNQRHIPLIQTYAFKDNTNYTVFVLSRDLKNTIPTRLRLPFSSAGRTTLRRLTGNPRVNNIDRYLIRETADTSYVNVQSTVDFSMPPGSVYCFVFENTVAVPPAPPAVTVSAASGQSLVTDSPNARWIVAFDRPMTGFDTTDLQFSGTANRSGVETSVEAADVPQGLKTTFLVTLRGLQSSGTVTLGVAAGRARAVSNGALNAASTAIDATITYQKPAPQNKLMVYDNFGWNVTNGIFLHGLTTGAGWKTPWDVQNFNAATYGDGYRVRTSAPLRFPNLQTTAPYAVGGRSYESAGRALDVSRFGPLALQGSDPPQVGQPGFALWASALLRKDVDNDEPVLLDFADSDAAYGGESEASRFSVGYFGAASNQSGVRYWSVRVRNADGTFSVRPSNVRVVVGQSVLLVARVVFGSESSVALYVNPTQLGAAPPTPAALLVPSAKTPLAFRSVLFYPGNEVNFGSCDEIRLGDTYAAVTPTASTTAASTFSPTNSPAADTAIFEEPDEPRF